LISCGRTPEGVANGAAALPLAEPLATASSMNGFGSIPTSSVTVDG
jgi:hypothetical protein